LEESVKVKALDIRGVRRIYYTPQRYRIEGQRRDWRFPPNRIKENPEGVAPSRVYTIL